MEKSFEEFIDKMKIPKEVFEMRKSALLKRESGGTENKPNSIPYLQGQLISIQNKMKHIEDKILTIANE